MPEHHLPNMYFIQKTITAFLCSGTYTAHQELCLGATLNRKVNQKQKKKKKSQET